MLGSGARSKLGVAGEYRKAATKKNGDRIWLHQIAALRRQREAHGSTAPDIVVAGAKYGTKFLAGCSPEQIIGVTRLRVDRVLYGPPGQ